ncbi:hypothetical protein [Caulobacter sp. S45]|uniref:hypothetical protein n=1 Tax=Caulobacter sp. S45 TaxID=1641861 RepID=UPI001575EE90|nr:hypothetical protein [Caulobacter sp. S45]
MIDEDAQGMRRENDYLKARWAELQLDVGDLSSQLDRVTQQLEQASLRRAMASASPLAGGQ